ncbi:Rrf2 family transcriptional regulator [Xaviernesmea oryzae]|uniref:Rrf2 family transcriptional regulator n=1 Tax=Xaviernesmea oryzae TaxID=464029 RepID=A0A1Q9AS79_9HYPH|nr:Rrf2 family transcriptional regulator [Xaviernesmea oryzae]OLP58277.1 Rrf2 family transcriptional regulator [Xaviernesmea oryzae]SEL43880.1 transcriptional regulator, BadM/Rrf2 family [Xaviernesmea oryzae]
MKLGEGVEQAIHCVALLSGLEPGAVVSAAALAAFHGVSVSYLLKHLQALSSSTGLLETVPGPRGGYRLARPASAISLLDIVLALEGLAPAFRCAEIRQRGPDPLPGRYFAKPCGIAAAMLKAERAYRAELARVTIADVVAGLAAEDSDGAIAARGCAFLTLHQRRPGQGAAPALKET